MARYNIMSLFFIAIIFLSNSPYSMDILPDTAQINIGLPVKPPLGRNSVFREFAAPSDTVSVNSLGNSGILYLDSLSIYSIQDETFTLRFPFLALIAEDSQSKDSLIVKLQTSDTHSSAGIEISNTEITLIPESANVSLGGSSDTKYIYHLVFGGCMECIVGFIYTEEMVLILNLRADNGDTGKVVLMPFDYTTQINHEFPSKMHRAQTSLETMKTFNALEQYRGTIPGGETANLTFISRRGWRIVIPLSK